MRHAVFTIALFAMGCGPEEEKQATTTTTDTASTTVTTSTPWTDHPILSGDFKNVAHRGGGLLAPENTVAACDIAQSVGAEMLELDVWSTADGVLVLMHDDTVDRTTDGKGAIKSLTYDQAQALDAGYWFTTDGGKTYPHRGTGVTIPALRDVLERYPDMLFSLEIKQQSPPIVEPLIALLDETGMRDKVVVGAFDDAVLFDFRQAAPDIPTSLGYIEGMNLYLLPENQEASYEAPAPYFAAPLEYQGLNLEEPDVAKTERVGLTMHVWTINSQEDMDMLLDWGVSGIITDDPALLQERLDARGL